MAILTTIASLFVILTCFNMIYSYINPITPNIDSFCHSTKRVTRRCIDMASIDFDGINDMMSFGNRMALSIRMPTKDVKIASQFISSPRRILDACWDKDKAKPILTDSNLYLLEFSTIMIPGLGQLKPEIEVTTKYSNGVLSMNSGNWTIKGSSGGIMKDSRFLRTFDIVLQGELKIKPTEGSGYVMADGWVEYRVQGSKPTFFRKAPSFLLDNTIKIIQAGVQEYATSVFMMRYLKSFRDYMRMGEPFVITSSPATKKDVLV